MYETDVLIMGAGCAGSSLAHHLERQGFDGSVALLDSRSSFSKEQRWCTWGEVPESMRGLVGRSWDRWSVITRERETTMQGRGRRYSEVYAPDFFRTLHSPWLDESSPTRLHLNQEVLDVRREKGGTVVATRDGEWFAKLVFDARFHGSPKTAQLKSRARTYLHQTFLGWRVAFPRPVFDPTRVVLMDFRLPETSGLNFMYLLPYSESEALIESTCFDRTPLSWQRHISNIQGYVAEHFGDDYWIEAEESGNLPMSSGQVRTAVARNHFAIGAAGGAIRPSSGYAFHRIQRTTREIAARVVSGGRIGAVRPSPVKYSILDGVFLKSVSDNLHEAPSYFDALFSRTDSRSLVRFMTDEGGVIDDLKVVMSLPKAPFIKGFVSNLLDIGNIGSAIIEAYDKVGSHLRGAVGRLAPRSSVRHLNR